MKTKSLVVLTAILFLAVLIRFYRLGSVPASLNWDEVSHGYNAYSLLKTGSDEWGQSWPVTNFRAYGDYPLPVSIYLMMPSIIVFGLNEFGLRFPTAFLGTFSVVFIYLLAKKITGSGFVAVMSALVFAISPWNILPSRGVFQSTIALFFLTAATWLFLESLKRPKMLLIAVITFGLSAYTYHNARILSFLLIPPLAFYLNRERKVVDIYGKKILIFSGLILLAMLIPVLVAFFSPSGTARANWVFIIDEGAINRIAELRTNSNLPPLLRRAIYNKGIYFISEFSKNYIGYFSPSYLFFKGGSQYQFSIPDNGLIYPVFSLFFYLGLFLLVRRSVDRGELGIKVLLTWLFLSPIPAAVTLGSSNVLRSNLMLPGVVISIAYGAHCFFGILKGSKAVKQTVILVILALAAISLMRYLDQLFFYYPVKYSWAWQYGYKEMVNYLRDNYDQYDRFIITKQYGEPHEFVLFYWSWDPQKYKSDPELTRYFRSDWYWVDKFDKFIFVNDWEVKQKQFSLMIPGKTLLVTSPGNYASGTFIESIKFLDGRPAFDLVKL